jgi:cytochrome P450
MKAGDIVPLPSMLNNQDERSLPRAAGIRFDRGLTRHSAMGSGAHRCVGAALARPEVTLLLERWLALPIRLPHRPRAQTARVPSSPFHAALMLPDCRPPSSKAACYKQTRRLGWDA